MDNFFERNVRQLILQGTWDSVRIYDPDVRFSCTNNIMRVHDGDNIVIGSGHTVSVAFQNARRVLIGRIPPDGDALARLEGKC